MNRTRTGPDVGVLSGSRWAVGIFSSREAPDVLWLTMLAVRNACGSVASVVDVLVNGNLALAEAIATRAATEWQARETSSVHLRVWTFETSDKASVWNTYIHRLVPEVEVAFFVDGYAQPEVTALGYLAQALDRDTATLAASGVPTMGPSAKKLRKAMLNDGGVHGNLYALRGSCAARLREHCFRLPAGLYRTDSVLGAALCFNLDPRANTWDSRKIAIVPEATWRYQPPRFYRPRDLSAFVRRRLRQAQGYAENLAVRRLFAIERRSIDSLPATASRLIRDWYASAPWEARTLLMRRPLSWIRCRGLIREPDLLRCEDQPRMLFGASVSIDVSGHRSRTDPDAD